MKPNMYLSAMALLAFGAASAQAQTTVIPVPGDATVVIERDGQQIPVKPDCTGARIRLKPNQRIKLTGPSPLGIHVQSFDEAA